MRAFSHKTRKEKRQKIYGYTTKELQYFLSSSRESFGDGVDVRNWRNLHATCNTLLLSPVFMESCLRSLASGLWLRAKYDFMIRSSWCLNDVRRRFCLTGRRSSSSRSPPLEHWDDDLPEDDWWLTWTKEQLLPAYNTWMMTYLKMTAYLYSTGMMTYLCLFNRTII